MPKNKEIEKVVKFPVEIVLEKVEEPKIENVSPLHFEFNNEGLNQLKDKVNEIVAFLNK